ncbi:restriction endonuclease subunit S [Nibrella viscosa]|uniref:Restriction endonuclease subunit S n=1 Tax=Nibrella viscosa TaxID=1084524 RepID=A0ABP8KH12_9BACT
MTKTIKLGEVIESPISGEWGEEGSRVKVLRSTNFTNEGYLDLSDVVTRNIPEKKIQQKKLKPGDIIIEKSGGSPNQPVGRVVYFDVADEDYLFSNFTSVIRPKNGVFPRFLFWFLFGNHLNKQTLNYQNKTTGIINLQLQRYIEETNLLIPPLPEQRRIAALLDRADALRQKDRQLLTYYDELAQSVFLDMFGDPVTNEKEWEVSDLGNMIQDGPKNGLYKPSSAYGSGTPILRIDSFYNGQIVDIGSLKRVAATSSELAQYLIEENDIVINRVNSRSHLGKSALIPRLAEPTLFESNMMRVKFKSALHPVYTIYILNSTYVKNQILGRAKDAVNQSSINQDDIRSFEIPIPPLSLQQQFASIIENIEHQKVAVRQQMAESEALFGRLLQESFGG